jgi:hypothetical protein
MPLHHKKASDSPALQELAAATDQLNRAERRQRELVAHARAAGSSWADIAAATGVTRHVARKRWHDVPSGAMGELGEAELRAEIGRAAATGTVSN